MDNRKTDSYYIGKMIADLRFILMHTEGRTQEQMENDEVLMDSVMFRLIQISENAERLTEKCKVRHPSVPWRAIKGLRNRIVHEYGNVDLGVVYETVQNDLPALLCTLEQVAEYMPE